MEAKQIQTQLRPIFAASETRVLAAMKAPVAVATKSNRNDLVTNVDRANQAFLVQALQAAFPQARIEGEEGKLARVEDLEGLVFFVDPIDGTMNFVKQRAHFAIMIGAYLDGQPLYGGILDVMRNELVEGGPDLALTLNQKQMPLPQDLSLDEALFGGSGPMIIHNYLHCADIALASSGLRITGSAGMEFKAISLGHQIGYISYLQPWDIAAGMAIGQSFGLTVSRPDGAALKLLEPGVVVAALPKAHAQMLSIMQKA